MSALRLEDEEQVLKVLAERGRIHAVVEIRRLAGCDLREAIYILTEIESKTRADADDEYVECEILAVGPFRRELRDCLPMEVDQPALRALVGDREVDRFVALRSAGFRFFFCPNG